MRPLSRRTLLTGGAAALAAAGLWPRRAFGQPVFTADEFRILPVRIHLLRAREAPSLNCALVEADARRILGKINGIWRQAGIQFYADAIRIEEAERQELFQGLGQNRTEGHLRLVRPRASQSDRMFHLYYIGEMRPNGICLAGDYQLLFVKETARLRKVPGGIDEDLPRVSAHEMGHGLGLPHRQDVVNLMASGTTGTGLNEAEITLARGTAEKWNWTLKPADALALAERLAEDPAARAAGGPDALYTVLAALPGGEIARAAREKLSSSK